MKYKVLTICHGGHVRSTGLKYLLTYKYGHEAIACGVHSNSNETRELLYNWADYIIVMTSDFAKFVPVNHHTKQDGTRKLFCYEVGDDNYHNPFHLDLQNQLVNIIESHGLFSIKN